MFKKLFKLFFFFSISCLGDVIVGHSNPTVTWDATDDSRIIGFYVKYGPIDFSTTNVVDVGNNTNCILTNLLINQTNFIFATSYDAYSNESAPSDILYYFYDASNYTNYLILTNYSDRIGMSVQGVGQLAVDWGDGNTNLYNLSSFSDLNISNNYGSAGVRTVSMTGEITRLQSSQAATYGGANSSSFGGDFSTMTSLQTLRLLGSNNAYGDISKLWRLTNVCLTAKSSFTGNISSLTNLMLSHIEGNNALHGNINNLTNLQWFVYAGSNTIDGDASNLTKIQIYFNHGK